MRIIAVVSFTIVSFMCAAQTSLYQSDLSALKSIIQKMPSYKSQIRGANRDVYEAKYQKLISDTLNSNDHTDFYRLAQLLFPLRDNHIGFYQVPDYSNFKTRASIDNFVSSPAFLEYPSIKLDTDSLTSILNSRPVDSLEGIYHYDKHFSVGVFKSGPHEYTGLVLQSGVNLWVQGQIAIHLYEQAPGLYTAIYGHPLYKYLIYQPVEKFVNHTLVNSYFYASYSQAVYSKEPGQADYVNLPRSGSRFAFKDLGEDAQYLLIQSFQNNPKTVGESQRFYDSIENLLTAPNLILDLRNNEGGADREMSKYLSLIKKYLRSGKLYVLINNGTLSQAELFILKLKKQKNVILVGQTSKGMLAYGSNFGNTEKLPSGRFAIYPTDMDNGAEALQYEGRGIVPDIELGNNADWIKQVLDFIRK